MRSHVEWIESLSPWPEEFGGRALRNAYSDTWLHRDDELRAHPVRSEEPVVWAGQVAGLVTSRRPAADVVRERREALVDHDGAERDAGAILDCERRVDRLAHRCLLGKCHEEHLTARGVREETDHVLRLLAYRADLHRVEDIMGMPVGIDLRDSDVDPGALDQAFDWFRWVDLTFSTYKLDSEISRLNARAGTAVRPDPLLVRPGAEPSTVVTGDCPPLIDIPAYRRRTA